MNQATQFVVADIADSFDQFNDDPDSIFGEYARVTVKNGDLIEVLHETEDWGVNIWVFPRSADA